MKHIGKILPIDGYYVQLVNSSLPHGYEKSLTHLYQPLIGMQAIMLYQTLLNEIGLQKESTAQTHHTLMNYLQIPLDEIYQARLHLEGIGLLKTYEKNTEDYTIYFYILNHPFSPEQFFQDAMLTQLLYHHLGRQKFEVLQSHYVSKNVIKQEKEITASFNDVFDSFKPTNHVKPLPRFQEEHGPNIEKIDFTWIEQMLKQRMIPPHEVLLEDNKRIITQMMTLYDLGAHEIEKSILWALTEENRLDIQEFQEACHDLFKAKQNKAPIRLVNQSNNGQPVEELKKSMTKEEQLITELERISPKQLLEDLSSGNQASEQDLKIIREIMTSQGLPSPVMNVLIHYVLLQSNMKLSKAYLEKIASHWSRANLKTAREAMKFAKKEKARYHKNTRKKYNYSYKKARSNEIIPEWFKERKTTKNKEHSKANAVDLEKEKEEIANLLRQYSNSTKNNNHLQG